jgi:integrase
MAVSIPFCIRRPDRPGYWFDRRVPKDLVDKIGVKHWRRFAGHTQAEARLKIAVLLAETEALIAQARSASPIPAGIRLTREQELKLLQGNAERIQELVNVNAPIPDFPEDVAALPDLGLSPNTVIAADLIDIAKRLKRPSAQTVTAWSRVLDEISLVTGIQHFNLLAKLDAQRYRDTLLSRGLKVSTVKLRLNYASGIWRVAEEEGLLSSNPFTGLTRRLRDDRPTSKAYDIALVDQKAQSLAPIQYDLYQTLRFTGCRLAEVLGLMSSDVDLERGIITIRPHPDRPLKTVDSERLVPIHPLLYPTLRSLFIVERPFLQFYKNDRWGGGLSWSKQIGLHPHGLRHHFTTQLRSHGVEETVIAALLGHRQRSQTSQYGSVPFMLLQAAVRLVT